MKVAAIQMNTVDDARRNEAVAERLIRQAAGAGAGFVALPEVAWFRGRREDASPDAIPGHASRFVGALAEELGIWIHGGTLAETDAASPLPFNTAFVCSPDGRVAATYRKIHLFDIDRPDLKLMESESFGRGDRAIVLPLGAFTLGFVICYDLRFPELWMELRAMGADLFVCPANFTALTGEAHWEVLLRARAIETQSYVMAPAQWGPHPHRDFKAFGRALVADPWGRVLSSCGHEGDGFAMAEIDAAVVSEIRRSMPLR